MAYTSSEGGGPFDVYVRTFPDDGRRWKVSPFPYSVSGDGQRMVAVVPDDASDQYSRRHITLWVNALTELRRPTSSQH